MRIAVIGAGAVGGYFGGRLAEAGANLTFIARSAHKAAIERDGLRLVSPVGSTRVFTAKVTDDPATAGRMNVVLIAVKLGSLEAAIEACRPLLGVGTAVIPLENGVEAPTLIAERLGAEYACGGVAYIGAELEKPGVVRHNGKFAKLVFGPLEGSKAQWLQDFADGASQCGFEAVLTPDIWAELWRKFVFLAPMAGSTSLRRQPIGAVLADAEGSALYGTLVAEAVAVGRARGGALPDDIEAATLRLAKSLPYDMRSSMLMDLEAGRPLELDWLTGAVVRLGAEAGLPTPESRKVLAALEPAKNGRPEPAA
jgi:2-dehydropantoate 2-reductase